MYASKTKHNRPDTSQPGGQVDIVPGLGERIAGKRDKVRIKYHTCNKSGDVEDEGDPFELTLGDYKHGKEFDEGIYGMKVDGTRQLKIPPGQGPGSGKDTGKVQGGFKTYRVALLAIFDPPSSSGTNKHEGQH